MCKELGNIAQGYSDGDSINEKGTNTVRFLTHEEIKAIPKDRRITYARIVVYYRPKKTIPTECASQSGVTSSSTQASSQHAQQTSP